MSLFDTPFQVETGRKRAGGEAGKKHPDEEEDPAHKASPSLAAGFGYSFFNEKLRDNGRPVGYEEFSGHIHDIRQPLVRQPGEGWEYGVSLMMISERLITEDEDEEDDREKAIVD